MARSKHKKCGQCISMESGEQRAHGHLCSKLGVVKAPGAVAPTGCFKLNEKAEKFYRHLR